MEHNLRCNNLKCRKEVNDHAVVTTCSHIFCLDCSGRLELSNPPAGRRPTCPACEVVLERPDDAVITNLNPTEDYKTSVLSGLSPSLIMECTGRALSFWAYQTTQQIVYDEIMTKSMTENYEALMQQTEDITKDANDEIQRLSNKLSALRRDAEVLNTKNKELHQNYTEEHKKYLKMKEQFDRMNHKSMLGHVQDAALENVERTVHASAMANRFDNRDDMPESQSYHQDYSNNIPQHSSEEHVSRNHGPPVLAPPATVMRQRHPNFEQYANQHNQATNPSGLQTMHSFQSAPQHRQAIVSTPLLNRTRPQNPAQFATPQQTTRQVPRQDLLRKPIGRPSPNGAPQHVGYQGYGMSGGMKTSYPQVTQSALGYNENRNRPRVASRIRPGLNQPSFQQSFNPNETPMARNTQRYAT